MKKFINKIKNLSKFKCWKYKYHMIIIDILKKRTKVSDVKHAITVGKIISDITQFKTVKIRHFKKLHPDSLQRAVDVHNKYTTGVKYDFERIMNILKGLVSKIRNNRSNAELLNSVVSGLTFNHPAIAIANRIFDAVSKFEKEKSNHV
jgi:hypothetical protein